MGKEKKKRRRHSTSEESDSGSDSSHEKEKLRRLKKKIKKEKEKAKKMLRKAKKKKEKRSKSKSKSFSEDESCKRNMNEKTADIPIELMEMSKAMAPMTKEEWEKRQSVVRRVLDEESGRYRLIKGDGEVIEEIVSRERHKEINKKATMADGEYFQSKMSVKLE